MSRILAIGEENGSWEQDSKEHRLQQCSCPEKQDSVGIPLRKRAPEGLNGSSNFHFSRERLGASRLNLYFGLADSSATC